MGGKDLPAPGSTVAPSVAAATTTATAPVSLAITHVAGGFALALGPFEDNLLAVDDQAL